MPISTTARVTRLPDLAPGNLCPADSVRPRRLRHAVKRASASNNVTMPSYAPEVSAARAGPSTLPTARAILRHLTAREAGRLRTSLCASYSELPPEVWDVVGTRGPSLARSQLSRSRARHAMRNLSFVIRLLKDSSHVRSLPDGFAQLSPKGFGNRY